MIAGPDISIIAALIGNPANANMLLALVAGPALTATELANEARLTLPTVSGHLSNLEKAGLVAVERQGRHRYFRLANADVVALLEALLPVAARAGHLRTRPGPSDVELRRARSCYDHLAGDLALKMFDSFLERGVLVGQGGEVHLTAEGRAFFEKKEIAITTMEHGRRPLCRCCLDWSERRSHLSGALGAEIFGLFLSRGWATRKAGSRIVRFAAGGERKITIWYSGQTEHESSWSGYSARP
jgi:DNA-binding transcriptional ArsR family regulator